MRFFQVYQYVVPLLLFPLSYWLWLKRYDLDHRLTILALSVPVVFSYVIPALGTNWLKIWEFNTRLKLGRFRPQHGFVFGTATSLLALAVLGAPREISVWEPLRTGFVMGSVLAFWNWWYDTLALRADFLRVYNHAYAEGRGSEAVALQYCPVFFGAFGFCYGLVIRIWELWLIQLEQIQWYWPMFIGCHTLVLSVPVLAYIGFSLATVGETGLRSYDPALQSDSSGDSPQESAMVPDPTLESRA